MKVDLYSIYILQSQVDGSYYTSHRQFFLTFRCGASCAGYKSQMGEP
ncbi:MAG: hypothetical protein JNK77_09900, partial [Saprospiraceae bacterium]|nr:hypothetical protein [Saprospiraceae bacterium]